MSDDRFKSLHRHEDPGHARFLTFSCFQNQPFLDSERARGWVVDAIRSTRDRYRFRLWAYCVMPNHAHLLIWPVSPVPPILHSMKLSVAKRALNWATTNDPNQLGRMLDEQPNGKQSHRFWQRGGGYDRNLWNPKHIWEAIDYIHLNPVKAGLCKSPFDWAWSSAGMFGPKKTGPLAIDSETIPEMSK